MFLKNLVPDVRTGPTGMDVMKVHAVSRIMLSNWIPNIQASWVKEGDRISQLLLNAGVHDLGGTLINESISTSAGAQHGQHFGVARDRGLFNEHFARRNDEKTFAWIAFVDDGFSIRTGPACRTPQQRGTIIFRQVVEKRNRETVGQADLPTNDQ